MVESNNNQLPDHLSVRNEQVDAGGTAETIFRDQILRREREQGNTHCTYCLGDHEQDGQPFTLPG